MLNNTPYICLPRVINVSHGYQVINISEVSEISIELAPPPPPPMPDNYKVHSYEDNTSLNSRINQTNN